MSSQPTEGASSSGSQFGDPRTVELTVFDPKVKCCFCGRSEIKQTEWGIMLKLDDIVAHHFCLLFSALLEQHGEDNEGIFAFLPVTIKAEVQRGRRLRCKFCKKTGATIGCAVGQCRQSYHYPCGYENGSLFQFHGQFASFCIKHKRLQEIPVGTSRECPICLSELDDNQMGDAVWPPCCGKQLFHRRCIMATAKAAGYFFKCPLCNSKDPVFIEAMKANGVFVPEQDAEWETEPNAFQELLTHYSRCDAAVCLCPEGREFITKTEEAGEISWQLLRCHYCASSATHLECTSIKTKRWKCKGCGDLFRKSGVDPNSPDEESLSGSDDDDLDMTNEDDEDEEDMEQGMEQDIEQDTTTSDQSSESCDSNKEGIATTVAELVNPLVLCEKQDESEPVLIAQQIQSVPTPTPVVVEKMSSFVPHSLVNVNVTKEGIVSLGEEISSYIDKKKTDLTETEFPLSMKTKSNEPQVGLINYKSQVDIVVNSTNQEAQNVQPILSTTYDRSTTILQEEQDVHSFPDSSKNIQLELRSSTNTIRIPPVQPMFVSASETPPTLVKLYTLPLATLPLTQPSCRQRKSDPFLAVGVKSPQKLQSSLPEIPISKVQSPSKSRASSLPNTVWKTRSPTKPRISRPSPSVPETAAPPSKSRFDNSTIASSLKRVSFQATLERTPSKEKAKILNDRSGATVEATSPKRGGGIGGDESGAECEQLPPKVRRVSFHPTTEIQCENPWKFLPQSEKPEFFSKVSVAKDKLQMFLQPNGKPRTNETLVPSRRTSTPAAMPSATITSSNVLGILNGVDHLPVSSDHKRRKSTGLLIQEKVTNLSELVNVEESEEEVEEVQPDIVIDKVIPSRRKDSGRSAAFRALVEAPGRSHSFSTRASSVLRGIKEKERRRHRHRSRPRAPPELICLDDDNGNSKNNSIEILDCKRVESCKRRRL